MSKYERLVLLRNLRIAKGKPVDDLLVTSEEVATICLAGRTVEVTQQIHIRTDINRANIVLTRLLHKRDSGKCDSTVERVTVVNG